MRALGGGSLMLMACGFARIALGEPAPALPPSEPAPAALAPGPGSAPDTTDAEPAPPTLPTAEPPPVAPSAPAGTPPAVAPSPPRDVAPPEPALSHPEHPAALLSPAIDAGPRAEAPLARDYDRWPLAVEARFGFNARLGSSFDPSVDDEALDTSFGLGAYLAWNPEYALGVELEHSGLGRVRALSGESTIDAEYSATSGWLAARVFPWRSERVDLFLNLRLGLAWQHVDALGTRPLSTSITVPAASFSCTAGDGPGIGLGAALGFDYRLARHFAVVTRLDAVGERLSGAALGTCADGIGSVTTLSGSLGLAYEFETAAK